MLARRGQPVARGRRCVLRRRRRVPHELPLPGDAAAVHVAAVREPDADHRHPRPDPDPTGELPVGDVPAQPRRADARDGDRGRAAHDAAGLRPRRRDAHQPRDPAPSGAAARQRPPQDRTAQRRALLAARHAGRLLRRRDRHGRQRLPRRPRRRAHPDAVDVGSQRRLLVGQPASAVPAADHRSGVPLRERQRRDPARQPGLAAVVDAPADHAAHAPPRARPRRHRVPRSRQPTRAGVHPPPRWRAADAVRREPVTPRATRRTRPARVPGSDAGRGVRPQPVRARCATTTTR